VDEVQHDRNLHIAKCEGQACICFHNSTRDKSEEQKHVRECNIHHVTDDQVQKILTIHGLWKKMLELFLVELHLFLQQIKLLSVLNTSPPLTGFN